MTSFSIDTNGSIGTLDGNAGTNTLSSANATGNNWNITGANAGNIDNGVLSSFADMDILTDVATGVDTSCSLSAQFRWHYQW